MKFYMSPIPPTIKINNVYCKYGKTANLYQRLKAHTTNLKYEIIIRVYLCSNDKEATHYIKSKKAITEYKKEKEIFYFTYLDQVISYILDYNYLTFL